MKIESTHGVSNETLRELYKHYSFNIEPQGFTGNISYMVIMIILVIILMVILIGTLSVQRSIDSKSNPYKKSNSFVYIGYALVLILGMAMIILSVQKSKQADENKINAERSQNNPRYETITAKGTVINITDEGYSNQTIKFNDKDNNIYYVDVPSDTIITTDDTITVKIEDRLIDDKTNEKLLSESMNKPEGIVIIKHHNKTYKAPTVNSRSISLRALEILSNEDTDV